MPNFVWQTRDLTPLGFIKYIFSPLWWFFDPISAAYFFVCLHFFGLQVKYFIEVALWVHVCNAFLFYLLCRRAKLSFQVGFFSALSMLFFFAQLHATLWPMAFQHLIIVFFVLLGLNLYLKTDDLMVRDQKFRTYWLLSFFVNLLASFCRFNVVALPIMMLVHIFFCSIDDSQKIKKLKVWLPVVAIYLGHPFFRLFHAGDDRLGFYFTSCPYWLFVCFGLAALLAAFYGFKGYVKLKKRLPKSFEKYFLLGCVLLVACAVFHFKTFTNNAFAIGYSVLLPFTACFKAFLEPLQTAQWVTSTWVYYLIPTQASLVSYFLIAVGLIYFILISWKEHRALLVLLVWYLMCYVYLRNQDPIRSRYFIYLAPIFSVIFCVVFIRLIGFLFSNLKISASFWRKTEEAVIALLFACLFLSNIAAVKFSLFRGRLVNVLSSYEYIKGATLIKEDLQKISNSKIKPQQIVILNVLPIPFRERGLQAITEEPTDRYFNAKAVFSQIFSDKNYVNVSFQKSPESATPLMTYVFNRERLEREGRPIDPFFVNFDLAKEQLRNRQLLPAKESFLKAIQSRPFLFRYLLGDMNFGDLRWLTDGDSLNDWFHKMKREMQDPESHLDSNTRRIFADLQEEINATVECLFYLAYLENHFGNKEKETEWIKQLKLLETNDERLQRQLTKSPVVTSDASFKFYREQVSQYFQYKEWRYLEWMPYSTYYAFEKFMLRLITL